MKTARSSSVRSSSSKTSARAPRSITTRPSESRWRRRKNSRNHDRHFEAQTGESDADADLSVLRRPHRGGARILQEDARRRGRDADAFQGRAGRSERAQGSELRGAGQSACRDAFVIQAGRPARDGLRRQWRWKAGVQGLFADACGGHGSASRPAVRELEPGRSSDAAVDPDVLLAQIRDAAGQIRRRLDRAGQPKLARRMIPKSGHRVSGNAMRKNPRGPGGSGMPYMLLGMEPVGQREARPVDDGKVLFGRMAKFGEDLRARGIGKFYDSLRPPPR